MANIADDENTARAAIPLLPERAGYKVLATRDGHMRLVRPEDCGLPFPNIFNAGEDAIETRRRHIGSGCEFRSS